MLILVMIKIHFTHSITIRVHQIFYFIYLFDNTLFSSLKVDKFTYAINSKLYIIFVFSWLNFFSNEMWNLISMWNFYQYNKSPRSRRGTLPCHSSHGWLDCSVAGSFSQLPTLAHRKPPPFKPLRRFIILLIFSSYLLFHIYNNSWLIALF